MDGCKVATALESKEDFQSILKQEVSQRVEEITLDREEKPAPHTITVKNEPKEQNGVKHERSLNREVKSEESDEDLKKYNRKIPEERSAVKKDEIDEHFDRWVCKF